MTPKFQVGERVIFVATAKRPDQRYTRRYAESGAAITAAVKKFAPRLVYTQKYLRCMWLQMKKCGFIVVREVSAPKAVLRGDRIALGQQ